MITNCSPAGKLIRSLCAGGALLASLLSLGTASGQSGNISEGKATFERACASCHGADARGANRSLVVFNTRLPDFTDCRFTAREPDTDWAAIIHNGGPARGFHRIMPSFAEALTGEQINQVIAYLRSLCNPSWPRGDLNLPRALFTEKAFPEDEAILTTAVNTRDGAAITNELAYEKRFGQRNQIEANLPFAFQKPERSWTGGVGDISLAFKRMLFQNLRAGSILSVSGEAILPTGDKARGFGSGVTVIEPFLSFGQLLPSNSFLQAQSGVELPTHTDDAARAAYWRIALGRSFTQAGGFGRMWSPMVEALADRELESGARTNWDIVPQLQVTLSARQHIMANLGVRVPANNTSGRPVQIVFYLLWDWFDGGLREGW